MPLQSQKYMIGSLRTGWGTWIRTKTNRVRVCCATVTPFPNQLLSNFNTLWNCPAIAPWAPNRVGRLAAVLLARRRAWQGCNRCGGSRDLAPMRPDLRLKAGDQPPMPVITRRPMNRSERHAATDNTSGCPMLLAVRTWPPAPFNFGANCALLVTRDFTRSPVFKPMTSMSAHTCILASGSPRRCHRSGE
jgi:hypothetical protein